MESGRHYIVHVSTARPHTETLLCKDTTRYPRNRTSTLKCGVDLGDKMKKTSLNDDRLILGAYLKGHHKDHSEHIKKYRDKGVARPMQGYPEKAARALIVYNGELTEHERRDPVHSKFVERSYGDHKWRVETVIEFGAAITGVVPRNGAGLVGICKPLFSYFHTTKTAMTLKQEVGRRLMISNKVEL